MNNKNLLININQGINEVKRNVALINETANQMIIMSSPASRSLPSQWMVAGREEQSIVGGSVEQQTAFTPSCAEKLVDGKLFLNPSMSANEKEPLHTGKWSQEEVSKEKRNGRMKR